MPVGEDDDPPQFDWWLLLHKAMQEKDWPAETFLQMTIPQLVCLAFEKPPSSVQKIRTEAEFQALKEAHQREMDEWRKRA